MTFDSLLSFSHHHCIAICAFLVPANLLATLQTLIFVFFERSPRSIGLSVLLASLFALLQVLHVASWFIVGVITPVTFILLSLSSFCLFLNFWVFYHPLTYRFWGQLALRRLIINP